MAQLRPSHADQSQKKKELNINTTLGYTLYPTPAPTPWDAYDRPVNGLHIDGIFFFLLWFGSWVFLFTFWAWKRQPRSRKFSPMPSKWEMPSSENWRN